MGIREQLKAFNMNDSKEAQRQAVLGTMELAFGRFDAVVQQWKNAGLDTSKFQFLNDGAKKILKSKMGIDADKYLQLNSSPDQSGQARQQAGASGIVKLRAPDGSVREVSADQAEHYIKLGAKRVQ
jgi:hypothetical protein